MAEEEKEKKASSKRSRPAKKVKKKIEEVREKIDEARERIDEAREKKEEKSFIPYEENHVLNKLGLTITVVPRGQAGGIEHILDKRQTAFWFVTHGEGTVTSDISAVLGTADIGKHIIFGIVRMDKWPEIKADLIQRFSVSSFAKGISFVTEIDAVIGVSTYKMMANMQSIDHPIKPDKKNKEDKKMDEEKENLPEEATPEPEKKPYESIFAIVNNGYTDLVMDAARKAGARGGTIINARGTGTKEIAKFFGVVITPEKEIVMILVPKDIRDAVLSAIYKEAGINTQGQGIAFSIPVSDTVGLAR